MSMSRGPGRRGAPLPYRLLAGVEPCPGGWLVVVGKLQGITLFPDSVEVLRSFIEVLDYRPAFDVIALHLPVGLPSSPTPGGRTCDREARRVLGWPRAAAVMAAPARTALGATTFDEAYARNGRMDVVQWARLARIAEVDRDIGSYHQRQVFEVNPELAFFRLNENRPLHYSKRTRAGRAATRSLLERRMPGVDRVLDATIAGARAHHVLDAAADLWTARRIAARAVVRLPEFPEWDDEGLRMEIVR
ncbi:MAG: DUF429 domain-containing protein [Acidimicrobiales bacterium]